MHKLLTSACIMHPHTAFSEYTEFEQELLGDSAPDTSSSMAHHGLYEDDETRARRQAWRRHVSFTLTVLPS